MRIPAPARNHIAVPPVAPVTPAGAPAPTVAQFSPTIAKSAPPPIDGNDFESEGEGDTLRKGRGRDSLKHDNWSDEENFTFRKKK